MHLESNLTTGCPTHGRTAAAKSRVRLLKSAARWWPFVMPWSAMRRMTGVSSGASGTMIVRGRLDGSAFRIEDVVRLSGASIVDRVPGLERRSDEPVCVSLPRSRVLVRRYRVPAESEPEIEAMLPHLIAGELPQSLDQFSWTWSHVPAPERGYSVVTAYLARNDLLESSLAPAAEAGFNVVTLVPEGWCWARALDLVGSAGTTDGDPVHQSLVIPCEGALYLVVARGGTLLYDEVLPLPATGRGGDLLEFGIDDEGPAGWDEPAFLGARKTFEDLYGSPLPMPRTWGGIARRDGGVGDVKTDFTAAVAVAGLIGPRPLLPPQRLRESRRRTLLGAVSALARLGFVALALWLAFTAVDEGRSRRRLAELEAEIAQQSERVAVLEAESAAIRESRRERASETEILRAVTCLRRHVKSPIHLEHLDYVKGRGVVIRGGATGTALVLEMLESLSTDPLWESLRVTQLRSEMVGGVEYVHFIVEGRMRRESDGRARGGTS